MADLASEHAARDGTAPRLNEQEVETLAQQVPGWRVAENRLTRDVKVKHFREALALVNRIGEPAEEENHHPDLCIHGWNRVRIELYTHTAHGLSRNDFILAARVNGLLEE
jgi:4a-hydroxytetrahydrobiopterin dehydratase